MDEVRHYINTRLTKYSRTCGSRTVLWHQFLPAVTFLELDSLKSMFIYFGTGSGKTITGCYTIENLKQIYSDWSVYILVKNSLIKDWVEEISKTLSWDQSEINNKIHILPFDSPSIYRNFFDVVKLKNFRDRSLFIIDESQVFMSRCVNKGGVEDRKMIPIFDYIRNTLRGSDKLLLMSATPISNSINEFKLYMKLLRPKMFNNINLDAFCRNDIIVSPKLIIDAMKMCCAAHNVQLSPALSASTATPSFAEKRVAIVEVEMSQHQKDIYIKADKQEKQSTARGFRYLTRSICNFVYKFMDSETKEFLKDEEIEARLTRDTEEFIQSVKSEESLKTYSTKFYKACEMIKSARGKCMVYIDLTSRNGIPEFIEYLKFFGITYVEFSGRTSATRDVNKTKFNDNKTNLRGERYKVIIISAAGTEGLNLFAVQNVFVLSMMWNDAVFQQLIGRSVRYNVHEDLPPEERLVIIRVMVSTYSGLVTTDQSMLKIIQHKYEVCSSLYKLFYNSSIDMSESNNGLSDLTKAKAEKIVEDMYNKVITDNVNFEIVTKNLKIINYTLDDGNDIKLGYIDNTNNLYDDSYLLVGKMKSYKIKLINKKSIYFVEL